MACSAQKIRNSTVRDAQASARAARAPAYGSRTNTSAKDSRRAYAVKSAGKREDAATDMMRAASARLVRMAYAQMA